MNNKIISVSLFSGAGGLDVASFLAGASWDTTEEDVDGLIDYLKSL